MLEYFYKRLTRLRQMRNGPLAIHLDGLARELHRDGYRQVVGQQILCVAGSFNIYLRQQGVTDASQVTDERVQQFIATELIAVGDYKYAPNALLHLKNYLQRQGVVESKSVEPDYDPDDSLITRYDHHLQSVRGLTNDTRGAYCRTARRFLVWFRAHKPEQLLTIIDGKLVHGYLNFVLKQPHTVTWKKHFCSDLRVFLRYLRWEGITDLALDRIVPTVPQWRLSSVPRHLPWEQVLALIDSIVPVAPEDKRDKALLLLIATLGLRNKEVRTLKLCDVAWRASELRLPQTKSNKARTLPLTSEVGELLADYILNGRPHIDNPYLFLSHRAPVGQLQTSTGVARIVKQRLRAAGIVAPSYGAHLLRHSLATRMINTGIPIKEIADLLGHASIDTTAIYTKVDIEHLATVALPFTAEGV